MKAQDFSAIDAKIVDVLDNPKDQPQWIDMMKSIETVIQEIKKMMNFMKADNQEIVKTAYEVYQLGKPKFIDHSLSEPDIEEAAHVTSAQFLKFHELRDDIDNLWNDFLDILSEKTGETLDYGVHGKIPGYGEGDQPGYPEGGGVGYGHDIGYGGGDYGHNEDTGYGGGYDGGYDGGYGGGRYGGGGFRRGRGGGRGRRGGGGYRGGFGPPYR